jgi:hypothetical protein
VRLVKCCRARLRSGKCTVSVCEEGGEALLDTSVGMYRDRYLKVQSTQGGCDEIYTRVRVDLVPSQPRLKAGLGSRPGIATVQGSALSNQSKLQLDTSMGT